MTRRTFRTLLPALFAALVLAVAPATALAQDDSSDLPVYPGPFDGSEEPADDSADTTGDASTDDEVLGISVSDLVIADGGFQAGTSIDNIGADQATSFIAPDIQPSSATAAAATAQGTATSTLANTGSEVEPILAVSLGLFAVGGAALVGSRRRLRDIFF